MLTSVPWTPLPRKCLVAMVTCLVWRRIFGFSSLPVSSWFCKMKFSVKCLIVTMTASVRLCLAVWLRILLVSARIYQASGIKFIGFTVFCSQPAVLSTGWRKPSSMAMSTVTLQQRESGYLVKSNQPFGSWKLSFLPIWSMKEESLRAPSIRRMSKTLWPP